MRFSRTNMRLAAARCRSLSRKIGVQTAEFSITAFCWRNADSRKSRTYERHNAEIRLELFNLSFTRQFYTAVLHGSFTRQFYTAVLHGSFTRQRPHNAANSSRAPSVARGDPRPRRPLRAEPEDGPEMAQAHRHSRSADGAQAAAQHGSDRGRGGHRR